MADWARVVTEEVDQSRQEAKNWKKDNMLIWDHYCGISSVCIWDVKVEMVHGDLDIQTWFSWGKVWTRDQGLGPHQLGSFIDIWNMFLTLFGCLLHLTVPLCLLLESLCSLNFCDTAPSWFSSHFCLFCQSSLWNPLCLSNKYFSRTYYVQGGILGVEDAIVNKSHSLPRRSIWSRELFLGLPFKRWHPQAAAHCSFWRSYTLWPVWTQPSNPSCLPPRLVFSLW